MTIDVAVAAEQGATCNAQSLAKSGNVLQI